MLEHYIHETAFIHSKATVAGFVSIAAGSSVWPGAVIRADLGDIIIGQGVNIQDGSVLHTDAGGSLTIGDYSLIGHMAMLHGCTVGRGCLIGINSTILDGADIGDGAMVAAGCMIRGNTRIPPFSMVLPDSVGHVRIIEGRARTIRTLAGSLEYMELARMHRSGQFKKMTPEDQESLNERADRLFKELFGFPGNGRLKE